MSYKPLRHMGDIEELERTPLAQRVGDRDMNQLLELGLGRDPGRAALHYVEDGNPESPATSMSCAQLSVRAAQAAQLFRSCGVGMNDPVVLLLPTLPQLYVSLLGAMQAGVAFPVNWMLKATHIEHMIRCSGAKAVVALGPTPGYEIWPAVASLRGVLDVPVFSVPGPGGERLAASDFDAQVDLQETGIRPVPRLHSDIAAYIHSGGTTGLPKIVRITHGSLAYRHWVTSYTQALDPGETVLADGPLFHVGGFTAKSLMAFANGGTVVIPSPLGARDRNFVASFWRFIERYRVSRMTGAPTTLSVLAKRPSGGVDLGSLKSHFPAGSTSIPVSVHKEIERLTGVRLLVMYGATENTGYITLDPRDGPTRYGSCGLRVPYTRIRTVKLDEEGRVVRECATDELGAIAFQGPGMTPGYLDPRHDAAGFLPGGWFNTGDLGRIDAEGYLWVTGRAKDLIIRGGHNIDPQVIEEALMASPDVLLAAAVAKPDAYAGELPVAYVQLTPGSSATPEDLIAFAAQHISERPALPKEIHVLERLPLSDVGKPLKAGLRHAAARAAFLQALANLKPPPLDVEVASDERHGTLATIVACAAGDEERLRLEQSIHDAMKPFAFAYAIRWEKTGEATP